jgi:deazaflavin-dependent oxidoreductase (nitroreductase family)
VAPAPKTRFQRQAERFASTRAGGWFFVNVANRVDRALLRISRGRLSLAVGEPVLLLTTRGARTGARRSTPLLYGSDRDRLVLVASKAGSPQHPAWYRNLKANPEVEVIASGRSGRYRAREAEGEERERLWASAVEQYAGYDVYQGRTGGRRIPVVVLEPA